MREFGDTLDLRGQTPFHIKPHPLAARVGESLDFIDEGLPGFHGLFRDAHEGLRGRDQTSAGERA